MHIKREEPDSHPDTARFFSFYMQSDDSKSFKNFESKLSFPCSPNQILVPKIPEISYSYSSIVFVIANASSTSTS